MTKRLLLSSTLLTSLSCASPVFSGTDQGLTLHQVMTALATVQHAESTFIEKKQSSFLTHELVLTGTLRFTAPNTLEKHVLSPFEERTVINHDQILIEWEENETSQDVSVAIPGPVRTLIDSIRATLAGDRGRLEKHYWIKIGSDAKKWSLLLVPKQPELKKYLKSILINGVREKITRITTEEVGGDRSTIEITYKNIITS